MALIGRLTQAQISGQFTHYARFAGIVPCYFAEAYPEGALLQVRNWWPDFLLPAFCWFYGQFIALVSLFDEDYEPAFPIVLTGEIERKES